MQFDSGTQSWDRFWFAARITAAVGVVAALIALLAAPDHLFQAFFVACLTFPLAFWLAPRFSARFRR